MSIYCIVECIKFCTLYDWNYFILLLIDTRGRITDHAGLSIHTMGLYPNWSPPNLMPNLHASFGYKISIISIDNYALFYMKSRFSIASYSSPIILYPIQSFYSPSPSLPIFQFSTFPSSSITQSPITYSSLLI